MWPYWAMFVFPAIAAFLGRSAWWMNGSRGAFRLRSVGWGPGWVLALLAITLMVGYRFEVGGDWGNYFRYLEAVKDQSFAGVLALSDPGYMILSWLSVEMGWGIYGLNLISAVLFASGLVMFCRGLPRPWLALAVSMPYLVLVLGMGYSRQGVALGLAMIGLVALQRKSVLGFVVWIFLGATFHKTAVLLLPIAALSSAKNRYWTLAWVGVVTLGAYLLLLAESVDDLISSYVEADLQSEGALVRLAMNALPATVLLVRWRRFSFSDTEGPLWRWFAIISLVLLGILFVTPSSTVVDRIALYMLPLQLVVFSYLPDVFGRRGGRNEGWVVLVLLYYAAVLFVWLNFATHAHYWIPYRFYPLEGAL